MSFQIRLKIISSKVIIIIKCSSRSTNKTAVGAPSVATAGSPTVATREATDLETGDGGDASLRPSSLKRERGEEDEEKEEKF